MNIDARPAVRVRGDDARNQRNSLLVEDVGDPVCRDGSDGRVAEHDFFETGRRRVPIVGGRDVSVQEAADFGQAVQQAQTASRGTAHPHSDTRAAVSS